MIPFLLMTLCYCAACRSPAWSGSFHPNVMAGIAARAADRGEIGSEPVPPRVLAAPHALLRHELLLPHHVPTDVELARIIDDIAIPANQHVAGPGTMRRGVG
jgi:hypothetical protein